VRLRPEESRGDHVAQLSGYFLIVEHLRLLGAPFVIAVVIFLERDVDVEAARAKSEDHGVVQSS
jgi:hypothetical protein